MPGNTVKTIHCEPVEKKQLQGSVTEWLVDGPPARARLEGYLCIINELVGTRW